MKRSERADNAARIDLMIANTPNSPAPVVDVHHYDKKPGAWIADRAANLESHDTVIGESKPVEPPTDLSHLRPDKKTTDTQ